MSVQKHGLEYLKSYSGILNIAEQVLNLATLISGCACENLQKTFLIILASILAFLTTGFLLITHVKPNLRKIEIPWHWYECGIVLVLTIVYLTFASVVVSELVGTFIVTGVLGYIAAMIYLLDTIDKFRLAVIPRSRYVWTTPNMPV